MRAQWELSVSGTPFPWQALALSSADELSDLAVRVASAAEHDQPLTDLDWLGGIFDRVLLGQRLVGLGDDFAAPTGLPTPTR
jgi:hypothetical protein